MCTDFLDRREGQIYYKYDSHDTDVPFQIVPSGNGTFLDTGNQGFNELYHLLSQRYDILAKPPKY
jgi:hypothetical protein